MEITIENITSASEITVTEPHVAIFSSIFAPIISVVVVGLIGFFTIRFNQKLHNRNALLDVFETFDSNHKDAEEQLRSAYRNNNLYQMDIITDPFIPFSNIVSRDYDQIGLLFERGLIPKEDYFKMYGRGTAEIHRILFESIKRERLTFGRKHYREYFTKLAIACYEYWKNQNDLPRDSKTNQDISETSLQAWKDSLSGKGGAST